MLAYTVFGEAGGPGKTTLSASLAAAHARRDRDVLVIDLDPQDASLTYLFDAETPRDDSAPDHLVRHMVGRPDGPFDDLVETVDHGIDLIPANDALAKLDDLLDKRAEMADDMGDDFDKHTQLRRVLAEANVPDKYDVVIVDPAATEGAGVYNGIGATASLVVPVEATAKGRQSIEGLEALAAGLEDELGVELGVLAVVPNKVDLRSGTQRRYLEEIEAVDYPTPVTIPIRGALFDGAWEHQCSPWTFVEEYRDRIPEREAETLETIDDLAATIEKEGGLA